MPQINLRGEGEGVLRELRFEGEAKINYNVNYNVFISNRIRKSVVTE